MRWGGRPAVGLGGRVVQAEWHGAAALTFTYTDDAGRTGPRFTLPDGRGSLAIEEADRPWSFDAQQDGAIFRLVSEGYRISLAYLFDPFLAIRPWGSTVALGRFRHTG